MESRIKLQLSYNGKNIKKNLFSKSLSNNEIKHLPQDENKPKENLLIPKNIGSCIYIRKFPKMDDKKFQNNINKPKKFFIDSLTEVRLPLDFVDLSYDNHQNNE